MKKNKKILLTIITLLISTLLFTNKVEAVYMYLECEYTDACERDTGGFASNIFERYCKPELNIWAPMTSNKGNLIFSAISGKKITNIKDVSYKNAGKCYIKSEKDYEEDCDDADVYDEGVSRIFTQGVCPSLNSTRGFNDTSIIPVGSNGKIIESSSLEENEYIIYSFESADGEINTFVELYYQDGRYAFIGPDPTVPYFDEIRTYQLVQIYKFRKDYFRVATNFETLMIASDNRTINSNWRVCKEGKEDCVNNHQFKVLLDSKENKKVIEDVAREWFEKSGDSFLELKNFADFFDNNKKLIDDIEEFINTFEQGKSYNFSEHENTAEEMVSGIEKAYNVLSSFYDRNIRFIDYTDIDRTDADLDATDSALTYLFAEYLGLKEDIIELAYKVDTEHYLNAGLIRSALKEDMTKAIQKISNNNSLNVLNANEKAAEYVLLLYTATMYLDANNLTLLPQNSDLSSRVSTLRNELFPNLIKKYNLDINPVIDCESLLGAELIEKINSYLNIIKIVIPILLIGLGIIDFTKAIFAGEDETMKKSQKSFIKRLGISILIFFVPTIVNLLLQLANKVWPIISPNSCGLFETKEKACYVCGNSVSGKYVWKTDEKSSSCTKYSPAKTKKECESMNNK